MKSRPEILDEIMFYILERAKCEEDTEKDPEHVLDYCMKDYKKQIRLELTMDEIKHNYKNKKK